MEGAILRDEIGAVGHGAERVERGEDGVGRVGRGLGGAGRLEREAHAQQITGIGDRNRVDLISLPRVNGHESLALQAQQRLADRLAADGVALGQFLLANLRTGPQDAGQDIGADRRVNVVTEQHGHPRSVDSCCHS